MSRALTLDTLNRPPVEAARAVDARAQRAKPDAVRFFGLLGQLVLLVLVMSVLRVGQFKGPDMQFTYMIYLAFAAFAVHYWLPFNLKETFWVSASVLAAFVWLELYTAVLLLVAGGAFYTVLRSGLRYWARVGLVCFGFCGAALMLLHPYRAARIMEWFYLSDIPNTFWPMFGSIFAFRMIIYLHDVKYMETRPTLKEYLAYFFMLPNYCFPLFPVIDYKTMRISYYRRDIHEVAQQGIAWICRGTLQLLLYRIVYHLRDVQTVDGVTSFGSLLWFMILTFLLYVRVSGQFHIIVGILHLFGYDLPETNSKYLLSSSLIDFWRRINIYWKEFMVKLVYFPTYFRLRKSGDMRAKILATVAVFVATWALHAYQFLWIRGEFLFKQTDMIFWIVLGGVVTANVWLTNRGKRPVAKNPAWRVGRALSAIATFLFVITLWSLWESPSVEAWVDLITWWRNA